MRDELPAEYDLLRQMAGLEIEVSDVRFEDGLEDTHEHVACQIPPDDVEMISLGLIFALGVLSFDDARPAGYSHEEVRERDQWTVADMVRHLRFQDGALRFSADYVRGRRMKTDVVVDPGGQVQIKTFGRGRQASHWVGLLQGKQQGALVLEGLGTTAGPES